jgi:hypothetical protein
MARSLADGVHGDRRAAHPQRGLRRKVIRAGRDERTLLRLSRISIARCADVIRSSAYAGSPLSQSVHRVTAARATDQRPCARDLRPGGAGSPAGLRWREMADASWPSWRSRLLMPGGVLSGYPAWPAGGAASQRAGPATFRIGVSDDGARDLVRQRRGGSAPPSAACQCPAALCGSESRLNRLRAAGVAPPPSGCGGWGVQGKSWTDARLSWAAVV